MPIAASEQGNGQTNHHFSQQNIYPHTGRPTEYTRPTGTDGILRSSLGDLRNRPTTSGAIQPRQLQARLEVSQPGDSFEQEAERIADEVMHMADAPHAAAPAEARGAPRGESQSSGDRLERRIQREPTPAQPVAAAPPESIAATENSGRPLDASTKSFMEPRFGFDFSQVRIHADRASADAASSVRARAYTIGSDIVFGDGKYQPQTVEGQHLLAHELTHVVQQTGGAVLGQTPSAAQRRLTEPSNSRAGNVVARKAEIDLEGWGSPLVGHDDSDVTFTPSGDFRSFGLQSDLAALADADFLAQFYREQQALVAGEWVHSDMKEQRGYAGTVAIKAGSKGSVEIGVKAHFFFDEKSNDTYDTEFSCAWDVEADLTGKLKITRGRPFGTPIRDSEAPFQLAGLTPNETADFDPASVQLTAQFNSYQFTDIPNINIGGNLDVGGKKGPGGGVSGGITLGNEQTYPAGVILPTFLLRLKVTDIPPAPEPKGSVTFGPMSMLREYRVLFPEPKHGKGQFTVPNAQRDGLIEWFQGLNETTKVQIIAGKIPISLEGRASTTGEAGMNLNLSDQRMQNVKTILGMFAGKDVDFDERSLGKYEAATPDQVESQEERTVIVSVWEQISEGESPLTRDTP